MANCKTFPNQRVIYVNRQEVKKDFLQIKKENWYQAYRDLKGYGLAVYLYCAGNKDSYQFALSPKAANNAFGMAKATFEDQIKRMIEKGYLVQRGKSNMYDFFETPNNKENQGPDDGH